jgi:hypothetical protein
VAGKPLESAQAYLVKALPLQADPLVQVWPDWFGRVPYLTFRTEVQVKLQS